MSNIVLPPKKHYGHLWIQYVYEFCKFAKGDNEIELHHHHQQLWKSSQYSNLFFVSFINFVSSFTNQFKIW
jgi:hypothetical protein